MDLKWIQKDRGVIDKENSQNIQYCLIIGKTHIHARACAHTHIYIYIQKKKQCSMSQISIKSWRHIVPWFSHSHDLSQLSIAPERFSRLHPVSAWFVRWLVSGCIAGVLWDVTSWICSKLLVAFLYSFYVGFSPSGSLTSMRCIHTVVVTQSHHGKNQVFFFL